MRTPDSSCKSTGQPWRSLPLNTLLALRDRYWERLKQPDLPYRERYQLDRHGAEIVEEIGLRLILRVEAGR